MEENTDNPSKIEETPIANESVPAEPTKKKVLLKERYEIDFNAPLEWLNNNGGTAFRVSDRIDSRRELFALVCGSETCPRSSFLPYLKSIDHPNILKLVEYGIIFAPTEKRNTVVLIYVIPQGGRVLDHLEEVGYKTNPQKLKQVILSLISASEVLKGYGITHRAIRPENLYFKSKDYNEIMLGDCLAAFPGYYQPAAYETIESLMAMTSGRGNGSEKNDIYAIAASCIRLLSNKEPMAGLSTAEIIRIKLKKGSYNALTADEKISTGLVNLLKGMLADTPSLRWSFIQTYNFIEGKSPYLQNTSLVERPKRALVINNEKCYTSKEVAYNLYLNPNDAWELIKSGKLLEWVKNGLENEDIYNQLDKIITQISEGDNRDITIAQIGIILDPLAPIHIRDISVFPDGAPKAIFYCLKNNININNFYDLFNSDLIRSWYIKQEDIRSPSNLSEQKININRKDIGYGIDRIIYDFDEDLPCLSPLVGDEYVNNATRVLKALDNNYANIKGDVKPYDKNLVAFLRSKLGKKIDGIILDLNSNKESLQISAIIRLYADMQKKYGPAQLANLGQWLASISKPVIESYHNLKIQKKIEKDLVKVSKSGKIIEIYQALEDEETKKEDLELYQKVKKEIIALINEKNKILTQSNKMIEEAQENALKFTGILAVMTMIVSFTYNLIQWISQ